MLQMVTLVVIRFDNDNMLVFQSPLICLATQSALEPYGMYIYISLGACLNYTRIQYESLYLIGYVSLHDTSYYHESKTDLSIESQHVLSRYIAKNIKRQK